MNTPRLITPSREYAASYIEAAHEGLRSVPEKPETLARIETDFDGWLNRSRDLSRPVTMPDGTQHPRVPQHDFWLVDGGRFLGQIAVRTQLNDALERYGGNIGYAVRASERRKGYGSLMMKLVLPEARRLGLTRALVTCDDDNAGSIRIIEGAGGVLQDKITLDWKNVPLRRYWITL